jgi:hypothetical protein
MCDYAVGLSRQLNGSIIPSERKTFLPLVISFFMPLKTTSLLYIKKGSYIICSETADFHCRFEYFIILVATCN